MGMAPTAIATRIPAAITPGDDPRSGPVPAAGTASGVVSGAGLASADVGSSGGGCSAMTVMAPLPSVAPRAVPSGLERGPDSASAEVPGASAVNDVWSSGVGSRVDTPGATPSGIALRFAFPPPHSALEDAGILIVAVRGVGEQAIVDYFGVAADRFDHRRS